MPYTAGIFSIEAGRAQTFPTITRDGYMGGSVGRLASKDLKDLNLRLLHYVTVYALFPRAGSFTEVTTHDALCMHATSQGLPFSLPLEVLDHIVRCRNRTGGALPYGMQITHIMRYFGVDFSGEDKIHAKQADAINLSVCSRFGYLLDPDSGQWVPKVVQCANPQGAEAGGGNEDVGGGQGAENMEEIGVNEQLQGGMGEQSRVADHGEQRAKVEEATQQLSPHIHSFGLRTPPFPPSEIIPAHLYHQLKGIKEDLLTHISQCFASMQKPHHVDTSPAATHHVAPSMETTPTPMHQTPITATPTVQLYTPIPTPTEVLTPSPATAYSVDHSPISSPSFADLPHASSQPVKTHLRDLGTSTGPTSSTPTSGNPMLVAKIESLISTVNRLAARVDGFDHRLSTLEASMSDKAMSMEQAIEQGSRRMQSSHTNLTNAVENFMIHLFHPPSNTPPPHQAGSHYTPEATYTPVNLQNPSTSQQAPHNKRSRRQRH